MTPIFKTIERRFFYLKYNLTVSQTQADSWNTRDTQASLRPDILFHLLRRTSEEIEENSGHVCED